MIEPGTSTDEEDSIGVGSAEVRTSMIDGLDSIED